MQRSDFFNDQMVDEQDLDFVELSKIDSLQRTIHDIVIKPVEGGSGSIVGQPGDEYLEVTVGTDSYSVCSGSAITRSGELINVPYAPSSTSDPLHPNARPQRSGISFSGVPSTDYYVYVSYAEQSGSIETDDEGSKFYTRYYDSYNIQTSQTLLTSDDDVILAKFTTDISGSIDTSTLIDLRDEQWISTYVLQDKIPGDTTEPTLPSGSTWTGMTLRDNLSRIRGVLSMLATDSDWISPGQEDRGVRARNLYFGKVDDNRITTSSGSIEFQCANMRIDTENRLIAGPDDPGSSFGADNLYIESDSGSIRSDNGSIYLYPSMSEASTTHFELEYVDLGTRLVLKAMEDGALTDLYFNTNSTYVNEDGHIYGTRVCGSSGYFEIYPQPIGYTNTRLKVDDVDAGANITLLAYGNDSADDPAYLFLNSHSGTDDGVFVDPSGSICNNGGTLYFVPDRDSAAKYRFGVSPYNVAGGDGAIALYALTSSESPNNMRLYLQPEPADVAMYVKQGRLYFVNACHIYADSYDTTGMRFYPDSDQASKPNAHFRIEHRGATGNIGIYAYYDSTHQSNLYLNANSTYVTDDGDLVLAGDLTVAEDVAITGHSVLSDYLSVDFTSGVTTLTDTAAAIRIDADTSETQGRAVGIWTESTIASGGVVSVGTYSKATSRSDKEAMGLYASANGDGTNYGISVTATGGSTNYGIYSTVANNANNYSGYFDGTTMASEYTMQLKHTLIGVENGSVSWDTIVQHCLALNTSATSTTDYLEEYGGPLVFALSTTANVPCQGEGESGIYDLITGIPARQTVWYIELAYRDPNAEVDDDKTGDASGWIYGDGLNAVPGDGGIPWDDPTAATPASFRTVSWSSIPGGSLPARGQHGIHEGTGTPETRGLGFYDDGSDIKLCFINNSTNTAFTGELYLICHVFHDMI